MANSPNTIWLKGMRERTFEARAGVAINPGHFILPYVSSGELKLKPCDSAGLVKSPKMFALEKEYLGTSIDVNTASYGSTSLTRIQYVIGDTVIAAQMLPGDEVYAKLAASAAAVAIGDYLEPAADGTLKKAVGTLTDSTGGTAGATLASITAGGSYAQADITALKNGLASIAAQINKLGYVCQALEAVDNSANASSEVFIRCLVL